MKEEVDGEKEEERYLKMIKYNNRCEFFVDVHHEVGIYFFTISSMILFLRDVEILSNDIFPMYTS